MLRAQDTHDTSHLLHHAALECAQSELLGVGRFLHLRPRRFMHVVRRAMQVGAVVIHTTCICARCVVSVNQLLLTRHRKCTCVRRTIQARLREERTRGHLRWTASTYATTLAH